jgi:hypothetical protein
LDFCINLQMRNDPSHDNTLIVRLETKANLRGRAGFPPKHVVL